MSHPIQEGAEPEGSADVATEEWRPHEDADHARYDHAVDVRVIGGREKLSPSDLASWRTITFAGTAADAPQQILGQDNKRHRAYIKATGNAGNFVLLGRQKQQSAAVGFTLFAGDSVTTDAASELWLMPGGTAVTISILEERYLS